MNIIVDWINRIIKHPRDTGGAPVPTPGDYGIRVVIHALLFPVITGMLMVDTVGGPLLVLAFTWSFLKYQRNEDAHTEDQAWKDISGYLWALALGTLLYLIIRWLL